MGYRGSKSIVRENTIVKEQRVDGNYTGFANYPVLRCTLMGLERDYQIRILSKGLHKKEIRYYSTQDNLQENLDLDP
jgi:hypothetical protein